MSTKVFELIAKHPELLATFAALGGWPFVVGVLGTLIEQWGVKLRSEALVKLGQRMEGIGSDLPKVVRGSRAGSGIPPEAP